MVQYPGYMVVALLTVSRLGSDIHRLRAKSRVGGSRFGEGGRGRVGRGTRDEGSRSLEAAVAGMCLGKAVPMRWL